MVQLKKITKDDLDFALKLRNENRQYFFHSKRITKKEHLAWFRRGQNNFYIIWLGKQRIGTLSYKKPEIGNVIIDRRYRKKGYLRQAIKQLHITNACVRVRPDNKIAVSAYKSLGFKEKEIILWK